MSAGAPLPVNAGEIGCFVSTLFRYADEGTFISLRAFDQFRRDVPPYLIEFVELGTSLDWVKESAVRCAQRSADAPRPVVFAPPIATFSNPERARGVDLANGLVLSVEIDEAPQAGRERLEQLLGPVTLAIESGSDWTHPNTGELQPKLHLHWRLSEATRDQADHDRLHMARDLAAQIIGADPTGKPVVHPLRWPGSWNTKTTPRLARIVGSNDAAEITLVDALSILEDAAGLMADPEMSGQSKANTRGRQSGPSEAPPSVIADALLHIPNEGTAVHYDFWIRLGYATWRATGGSDAGFDAWQGWSKKSAKYDGGEIEAAWRRIGAAISGTNPARRIGAGTIFHHAAQHGWNRPNADPGDQLVLSPSSPLISAREFVQRQHTHSELRTLHHQNDAFYSWTGTHYSEATQEEVRADLYSFLDRAARPTEKGNLVPFDPTKAKVANVLEATAAVAQLPHTTRPPAWLDAQPHPPPAELIACTNRLLHLPTRKLQSHTPAFFTVNALEFGYRPAAPPPSEWLEFLAQLWPRDQAAIDTLQDLFGLLLTGDTRHQKAFLIVGPKRSGKGTIARVLTKLLGQANVCGPTLSSLGQNFGLAPLIGKRLAVISDARLGGKTDQQMIVERLLAVTGEDSLTVDRKFRDGWTGRLETRFLILTNELPRLFDASGALASRFVILMLRNSFFGKEDHGLTERLTQELPGILNWSIGGWERLQERGYFVPPASSIEAQQELEDLGSPIGAFLRERCKIGPENAVPCDDLYTGWLDWCRAVNRMQAGTTQEFGRNLRAAVPGLELTNNRTEQGSRVRRYQGVRLRWASESDEEPLAGAA